ncbi:hypothetical protein ABIA38_008701 [Embleya sp. AB8]
MVARRPSPPGSACLIRGRGRLSGGHRGVGLGGGWPWVRSAGPGRGGGRRLVVARPLRGRGLCLVLRIRAARPLRGRCRPGRPCWLVVGGGWPLGVVVVGWWVVAPGPFGGAGSWRLPASRRCTSPPGPGSVLGAPHPCCPSTTWPSLPGTTAPTRGRGPLSAWRPRWLAAMPRFAAPHGSRSLLGPETGSRRDSQGLGRCVTCGFTRHPGPHRPASAGFVHPGPNPRHDKAEKAAPRRKTEHRTDTPPKNKAGSPHADRNTRRPTPPGPKRLRSDRTTRRPPDNGPRPRLGEAASGSDGHVVDGQHGCEAPDQNPGPGGDEQRRDAGHHHDPAPPNQPGATTHQPHTTTPSGQPPPTTSQGSRLGRQRPRSGRAARMRSTKQRPRPRRGRATTTRGPPPRPGPAERTRGHHPPAHHHDPKRPTAPDHEPAKPSRSATATQQTQNRLRSKRAPNRPRPADHTDTSKPATSRPQACAPTGSAKQPFTSAVPTTSGANYR